MSQKKLVLLLSLLVCLPVTARKKKVVPETSPETEYHKITGRDSVVMSGVASVVMYDNKYYLELPLSLIGRQFMVVNRMQKVTAELNEASANKGLNYSCNVVCFELDDDMKHIRMREQRPTPLVASDQAIARSVADNYANPVLAQWEVKAMPTDSSTVVFPIHTMFNGEETTLNDVFNDLNIGQSPNTKLSRLISLKTFDSNIVATSELTTVVHEGHSSINVSIEVSTSLCLLPEHPMRGRAADDRVGYFRTPRLRYTDTQQRPIQMWYANRWRLEPSDTAAYMRGELVAPVKPIIIYIDPATPEYLRPAIKKGIEDWNEAFERAGFRDAIRAEMFPDTLAQEGDDVKYSVLTYAASLTANAMGPSLTDPRTGEILEADIIWWHNVSETFTDWLRVQTSPYCEATRRLDMPDTLMQQAARFVASHEMGHSLGLRHNFIASATIPTDSLLDADYVRRLGGQSPSIMDYTRYNYVARPGSDMPVIAPHIGAYDCYAIEWGYRWWPDEQSEKEGLQRLIETHRDPIYRYCGDQSTRTAIDPRAMSEDLGNDPIKSATYGVENLKCVVPHIIEWTTTGDKNQSYEAAANYYLAVMSQWNFYNYHILANIGGMYIDNTVVADGTPTYAPVEKARQRAAVQWLINNTLNYPDWLFNTYISHFTYIIRHRSHDVVLQTPNQLYQNMLCYLLWDALDNARLMRMAENELINGADAFTATEYLDLMYKGIFAATRESKSLTIMQRYVQKAFVDALITAASSASGVKINKSSLTLADELMAELDHGMCGMCRMTEASLTIDNYGTQVTRLSDPLSVKRGVLTRIERLLRNHANTGDQPTRDHYSDLLQRIETALAPHY